MHDPEGPPGHRRAGARHFPAPRPARRGAQGVRIRRASRFCWSCRSSIRQTGSTTSTPWPSAARPGRGPSCAVGLATPISRCAQRPLKRWHTLGSTTSRRVSPSRGWRAMIRRSGRWPPTRCGVAGPWRRCRSPRAASRRHVGGRGPGRANASVHGACRLRRVAGPVSRPDFGGLLARQMLWQPGAQR